MLWVMGQTGHQQVDCSSVVGQQRQKSDRQQMWDVSSTKRSPSSYYISVIFVNENENGEKRENNKFVK